MRVLRTVFPVLALVAMSAGCSSSNGKSEQQLTEQREGYCTQLGAWQKARNAADSDSSTDSDAPESPGYDEVGAVAEDALLAMQPLRDEAVGGGRTLGEATAAAMKNGDSEAEGRVVEYCGDSGYETLTR
ncbi:hypothetical protein [Streptomyces sp. ADI92-24]|uniref:hypothetical protein n=1 Tax=Streptomyces sp. ADI92-24 TaxID=1522756 RepID=UPI000F550D4C|nr:hypothetical protein [Streptomyces sp. ADI92-24]